MKVFWLEEGDSNSKFFHATASIKKKKNHIATLKTDDGREISKHDEFCNLLKCFYANVFAANDTSSNYV